ncbi:hypothetical protein HDZ31DRAFT_74643 [Schizophyllum fasciatum]
MAPHATNSPDADAPRQSAIEKEFVKESYHGAFLSEQFAKGGKAKHAPEARKLVAVARYLPECGAEDVPNALEEMTKEAQRVMEENAFAVKEIVHEGQAAPGKALAIRSFDEQDVVQETVAPSASSPDAAEPDYYFTVEVGGAEVEMPLEMPFTMTFQPEGGLAPIGIAVQGARSVAQQAENVAPLASVDGGAQTDDAAAIAPVASTPLAVNVASVDAVDPSDALAGSPDAPVERPAAPVADKDDKEIAEERPARRSARQTAKAEARTSTKSRGPRSDATEPAPQPPRRSSRIVSSQQAKAEANAAGPKAQPKKSTKPKAKGTMVREIDESGSLTIVLSCPRPARAARSKLKTVTPAQPRARGQKRARDEGDDVLRADAKPAKARRTGAAESCQPTAAPKARKAAKPRAPPAEGTRHSARAGTAVDYTTML